MEDSGVRRAEALTRPCVPALDKILGAAHSVLSAGFVRLVDYMGDDRSVVQAARVSYGSGTKKVQTDRALIRYLMRHSHTTPFEMCEIKLHIRAPMDVWRQWIRHRTASVNEYSTRYSLAIEATEVTLPNEWRLQSSQNRQGSTGYLSPEIGKRLSDEESQFQVGARNLYGARIDAGVAREQARKDLPLSTYTEAYWKIDLHNLLHFLKVRMEPQAQLEIRLYASIIGEQIVSKWVPMVWEAFTDYERNAFKLSGVEFRVVNALIAGFPESAEKISRDAGLMERSKDGKLAANRERSELETKLKLLGLTVPWIDTNRA